MLSVADIIASSENRIELSVTRAGVGSYVDGIWVPAAPSAVTITGVVQPLSERDLRMLPEGQRSLELLKIYTSDIVYVSDEKAGRQSDEIAYQGDTYRVLAVRNWLANGYVRVFMERLKT